MEESNSYTSLAALASSHLEKKALLNGVNDNTTIIGSVDTAKMPFLNPMFIPKQKFVIPKLNMGSQTSDVDKVVTKQIAEKLKRSALELERKQQQELELKEAERLKLEAEERATEIFKALSVQCKSEVEIQPMEEYEEFEIQFFDCDFVKPIAVKEPLRLSCAIDESFKPKIRSKKAKASHLGRAICSLYSYKFLPYMNPRVFNDNIKEFQFDKPSPDDFILQNLTGKRTVSEVVIQRLFEESLSIE